MDRWRGKTAVLTGTNSGIGKAMTRALLKNGINVVGLDIDTDKFSEIEGQTSMPKSGIFYGIKCDISRDDDIQKAFVTVKDRFTGIDILVNCAGVIEYSRIIEGDRRSFEKLLNINVLAVATCIRLAVESMRNRRVEGHIFNVNSILGHEIPMKGLSDNPNSNGYNLYPACKHATVAMTHSVRRELAEEKLPIRITSISPGFVKTNIAKNTGLKNLYDEMAALEADDVAEVLLYALGTRPEVQITELTIRRTGEL